MKKIINYDPDCLFCTEGFIEDASSYDEASGYCLRGSICECATVVDYPDVDKKRKKLLNEAVIKSWREITAKGWYYYPLYRGDTLVGYCTWEGETPSLAYKSRTVTHEGMRHYLKRKGVSKEDREYITSAHDLSDWRLRLKLIKRGKRLS